jgi:hypothetical protein
VRRVGVGAGESGWRSWHQWVHQPRSLAPGQWRLVPFPANRQPATANYLRRPGDSAFQALSIDVLRVEGNRIVEVNCFLDVSLFTEFGLPLTVLT